MKLLIDSALSPVIAQTMRIEGHDAVHLRDLQMQAAADAEVFAIAESQGRIIVSADTDFGALLALRQSARPSFILFRKMNQVRPAAIAAQLSQLLDSYAAELEGGCILTVTDESVRIRRLPII